MNGPARRETFLARWSRRKEAAPELREREDARVAEATAPPEPPSERPSASETPSAPPADLPPVESLTPESDFSRFMRPDVPARFRSAAVKRLFSDPHFNLMDGLDVYIDDYTRPDPIPPEMLRSLAQSAMLGLFERTEDDPARDAQAADPHAAAARPAGSGGGSGGDAGGDPAPPPESASARPPSPTSARG